ncbi:Putative major facilitator superfamily, MFS transporter superfamily [Septoria linicola]|uniref:Probable transporter MCH1 n=1 Tax=Septoria linicola TaxID=215465 RepID=A0A9Q9B379_9PEZI|nr:Putative major facilitator superfamily, MFS transporter superfamily [Septoria linicola]
MAPSSSRPSSRVRENSSAAIDKLDYTPGGKPLLAPDRSRDASSSRPRSSEDHSYAGSFFSDIAEGIVDKDRERFRKELWRYGSFAWALINTLGAGSITAYSLYAPLFQHRLHYSQLQVNGISITAEIAMYLPVPIWGMMCDRFGPGIPSLLAGSFFGVGYLLAAFDYKSGPPPELGGTGWPYCAMVVAFIFIGMGTSLMYLSAVTTCAKNFGRGKYKGIALALPIACFGLSGMWQAQVGSQLLYETRADGTKGDVNVHKFFLFLGIFLLATGIIGCFALRIVNEEELIEDAVEELEQSGFLDESQYFHRLLREREEQEGYGTLTDSVVEELSRKADELKAKKAEEQRLKTWLLNAETRRFLSDRTMWFLAAGFLLVTGPGEAFINNLGTIIDTLYPPLSVPEGGNPTSAATHVSIVAVMSTIARILTGTLTDILAPTSVPHQHRRGPSSLANSLASLPPLPVERKRLEISRVTFLVAFCILMSAGQVILATGVIDEHGERFWLVSASIGAGYGAAFSLTPIIVSVIWGVENFGTNWGIVAIMPAIGATIWGLVYSGVYQWAAELGTVESVDVVEDRLCYGVKCYAATFWGMAVCVWAACGLWFWAWKGPGGWTRRGIAV